MPNPRLERQAIRSRINTLKTAHPEIQWILREHVGQVTITDGDHVIIDIVPGRAAQVGSGNPRLFRTRGALTFRIATSLTGGAKRNEEIAELIIPFFRSLLDTDVAPPIRYYTPVWAPSELPEETWFVGRLVVEWQADFNEAA